jgi:hypothetical protein
MKGTLVALVSLSETMNHEGHEGTRRKPKTLRAGVAVDTGEDARASLLCGVGAPVSSPRSRSTVERCTFVILVRERLRATLSSVPSANVSQTQRQSGQAPPKTPVA